MARFRMVAGAFWQLMGAFWQLIYGVWRVSKLPEPRVSIFGGSRFKDNDPYFTKAKELGYRLAQQDISILTGGGPGIMEAASCGVIRVKKKGFRSMGVEITGVDERPNECIQEDINMNYFFTRNWLLTSYSVAFIVFPGGFGTLMEMSEVLTRVQTKKLKRVPIILVGVEFWTPFMYWLKNEAQDHGAVSQEDLSLFAITDDLDQVCTMILNRCREVS